MSKKISNSPIKVNAYSGYRVNERPMSFSLGNSKIDIIKIIYQWTEPEKDFFIVQGNDRLFYTLFWDRGKDIWTITEGKKAR